MKRQLSEWEKITANEVTDKKLISKIYKKLLQLNIRKTNNPIQKKKKKKEMGRRPKQTFLQKDIQLANKHIERCSTSLMIRERQIKTTKRYHLTPARMAIIKKNLQTINIGEDVGTRELSHIAGGTVN